jgi:hypothetical protein
MMEFCLQLVVVLFLLAIISRPCLTILVAFIETCKASHDKGPDECHGSFARRFLREVPYAWQENKHWFRDWLYFIF